MPCTWTLINFNFILIPNADNATPTSGLNRRLYFQQLLRLLRIPFLTRFEHRKKKLKQAANWFSNEVIARKIDKQADSAIHIKVDWIY